MGLILRSIERMLKMQFSMARKFTLQPLRRYGVKPPKKNAGLMCPRPMCPRPEILGCCSPWTKRPLDIVSLTNLSRPWTLSSMELAPSAASAASVGLRRLMDPWGVWPASPTPLTRFIGLAPLRQMHARPTHRTPPLCGAEFRDGMVQSGAK